MKISVSLKNYDSFESNIIFDIHENFKICEKYEIN